MATFTFTTEEEGVTLSSTVVEVTLPQSLTIVNNGDAGSADLVTYDPSGQDWPGSDPTNVQDAIADLVSGGVGGGAVDSVDGQTGVVDLSGSYDPLGAADAAVAGFGDVVTHDADEFATAAQGATADTAVQPGDSLPAADVTGTLADNNIPASIARDTEVTSAIATHAGATDPHGDRAFTTSAVSTAINNLINSAPGTLDTLGEIAAALQSDESGLAALTTVVNSKVPMARTIAGVDLTADISGATLKTALVLAVADVAGAVAATRTITAGTGLTGGGDLSADRTFAPDFGTGAGKVTQGNDSRLSDARTPTAHHTSHESGGGDALTLAQAQITGLTAALAALVPTTRLFAGLDLSADRSAATVRAALGPFQFYGDGSDGNVTISGTTTLTRDMYYNDLAVTGTLNTANFRVFVAGTFSGNGTVDNSAPATGTAALVSGPAGALPAGAGGAGRSTASVGLGGTGASFGAGGAGGAGGLAGANAGGAGGVSTLTDAIGGLGSFRDPFFLGRGYKMGTSLSYGGGSGGGSGAVSSGTGTSTDGAGGPGGGNIVITARLCTFTGLISSNGAAGKNATATVGGGGGGGGGGTVFVVTSSATQTFTTSVVGGAGGTATGGATNGSSGSSGLVKVFTGVF